MLALKSEVRVGIGLIRNHRLPVAVTPPEATTTTVSAPRPQTQWPSVTPRDLDGHWMALIGTAGIEPSDAFPESVDAKERTTSEMPMSARWRHQLSSAGDT